MKMNRRPVILPLCLSCLLTACAARKDRVVLLPDPDGKTEAVIVSNQGGS